MGQKSSKSKKDCTVLTEDELNGLATSTSYSKEQIQEWHTGFIQY